MRKEIQTTTLGVALALLVACAQADPNASRSETPAAEPAGSVPITRTIGWWGYQDALHITGMDVELPGGQLGLLKGGAVIRFHIHGSLVSAKRGWRPHIGKVHISQRFVRGANGEQAGEIALTPVVEVAEDAAYVGEPQSVDLQVGETVSTYRWGQNRYLIRCGPIEKELQLFRAM